MRFKLVKTGRTYGEPKGDASMPVADITSRVAVKGVVPPIIWETGNVAQIRSLLVLREAELVVAKAQLTGEPHRDWYVNNVILDLEIKITDLKKWLAEAMGE